MSHRPSVPGVAALIACAGVAFLSSAALAGVPPYALVGTFSLPQGASAYDVLPDGRLIAIVGNDIVRQDAINTSSFSPLGSVPAGTVGSFGASFLRVSPTGSTIAIGNNVFGSGNAVHTLPLGALSTGAPTPTTSWTLPNTDAHWADNDTLFVTGFDSQARVFELDLAAASTRAVVSDIGGASAGVVTDGTWLYTGNGFDFAPGGSSTGDVRAIRLSDIASLAPGATISFETQAVPVARALSAASLGFDALGNLLVGGGDSGAPGQIGFAAVIDADTVNSALLGGSLATDSDGARLFAAGATDSHFVRFSAATGELLVTYYDNSIFAPGATVYRYAIPAPGMVAFAGVFLAFGSRRRRA